MSSESTCTAAVMLHAEGRYFVMAQPGDPPTVRGFRNQAEAVRHFEDAYARAHGTSAGHSAGAVLNFLQLQPRVFNFMSVDDLIAILGETVHTLKLTGEGVFMLVFEAANPDLAKSTYEGGIAPRLVSTGLS